MVLRDASASKKKYLSNSFISGTKRSRYLNWVKNLRLLVELIFEQVTPARSSGKCLGADLPPLDHKSVQKVMGQIGLAASNLGNLHF